MSRNDTKSKILSIIYDSSISVSDKNEQIIPVFHEIAQDFGCQEARKLAKQIEKESGFNMCASMLLIEIEK